MTTNIIELISYENAAFRAYVFWSAILIMKMLAMAFLTSQQRSKKQVTGKREPLAARLHTDPVVRQVRLGKRPEKSRVKLACRIGN